MLPRQLLNDSFQLKHNQQRRNLINEVNPLPPVVEAMLTEQAQIRRVLAANGSNITKTAWQLGLTRQALYRRLEKYGIR